MSFFKRIKKEKKRIALERIRTLFKEAEVRAREGEQKLADRYVAIARKIAMKHKVKIPKELKRRFCKHCYSYLTSRNSRIRIRDGKLVVYCFNCKKYTRLPYK